MQGSLRVDCLDVTRHHQLVEDQLPIDHGLDLANYPADREVLVDFLKGQASQELVLDEDLLDAGIGAEF